MQTAKHLFSYDKYWAECFGVAPFLPTTREEMDQLGWDSCDVILITGDAYVDHPSFGMAVIGRLLEANGYRVGIIDQPEWHNADAFKALGQPNLFFGVTAGNMDSMINRYTADRKLRHDDAYTPDNEAGKRPDRCVLVYSQRCREAYKETPIVIGGIEASLRRLAHYDYWSDKVRRSVLVDAKADILLYGNAERALIEVAQRLSRGQTAEDLTDIRGTAYVTSTLPEGQETLDSSRVDPIGKIDPIHSPYQEYSPNSSSCKDKETPAETETPAEPVKLINFPSTERQARYRDQLLVLPSFEKVRNDPILYAHANRVFHQETNPGNARSLAQQHGQRWLIQNPPPIPLETGELDSVFELPFARVPHPKYEGKRIPAYEMIRFSVNIMRGCFGGCTFCSITEHEGRIIQSRSHESIVKEVENIRDKTPGFTGSISDLGGPTANMWRLNCKSKAIEASCRRPSCVYPGICKNLDTDQTPLIDLYRDVRSLPGIKRVLIASGLRYDLAVETPAYVKELVTHHVGGYLKIAPEHTESGPLSKMMKPGMGTYDRFKAMFDAFSKEAGKEQYLIPYFIAAHPGTTDEDMMNLALWLKTNGFKADQVQNFYPSPMAYATAMYHSERNPLKKVSYKSERVSTAKGAKQRRLHKAYLRYHDPNNWDLIRASLRELGRADLIGHGKVHLVPPAGAEQPSAKGQRPFKASNKQKGKNSKRFSTQHTGLPKFNKKGRRG